jgi:hypothetical protein
MRFLRLEGAGLFSPSPALPCPFGVPPYLDVASAFSRMKSSWWVFQNLPPELPSRQTPETQNAPSPDTMFLPR